MRLGPFLLAAMLAAAPAAAELRPPESAAEIALSFAPVVRQAAPAVVTIHSRRIVAGHGHPFADDPFFGGFFRDFGPAVPREQTALGSGVIVGAQGIVVSNHHVVGGAQDIRVVLPDGREFDAELLLDDAASDLAVLRLRGAAGLPVLTLRDSDEVEVGDLVLAIGNPFGVGQTVSMGIVSALARSGLSGAGYFIQTDAAINPGNSGGALVDLAGRLVGINTAIVSRSGGSQGVGLAIPANLVAQIVAQAEAGAVRFRRPWAGVIAQPVDAGLAEGLGMELPRGVVLSELHPKSPFRAAGLLPGDVVLALGGAAVNSPQELQFRLSAAGIGGRLPLRWLRAGREWAATVALMPPPEVPAAAPVTLPDGSALAGLSAATINPALGVEFGLPLMAEGVVVTEARGWAARVGLRPGDILRAVNGVAVPATAALPELARPRAGVWQIDVLREGRPMALRFRL